MPLTQLFPLTLLIDRVPSAAGFVTKRWPDSDVIKFVLNDAQFTDPAQRVSILMQISPDNKVTWQDNAPYRFVGGAKSKDGSPPFVTLGPYEEHGVIVRPTHVRFAAWPGEGDGQPPFPYSVTIGLDADTNPDD